MRVYYEDTDFGGVVYYANYLRYFERARTEWLRSLDVDHQRLARDDGLQFVVRRAEIDFLRGAKLDDELNITVECTEKKRTYLMLRQRALRGAEPMAEALVQVACVRREDFKPAPIPAALAARLGA
ncbi:MAG: tol-pal system-associated acyl-CoA thioesterase [Betaproteobacteria bacterium]|nr:tol-pal system-associated acyl-CoA thioesterase [Betaproteobacteria bacterium]MDH4324728.1 tol-pal system-associated acyl-CoA thioesterase [Betaproteobacteria bacterium]